MKPLFALILMVCISTMLHGQINIRVKIDQLATDTIWFGTTVGKRALPLISAKKDASGWAELKTDSLINPGFYAVMFKRGVNARYTFLSLIVEDGARNFTVESTLDNTYANAKITGNQPAKDYIEYYDKLMGLLKQRDALNDDFRLLESPEVLDLLIDKEKTIRQYQQQLLDNSKSDWVKKAISWTLLPDFSEATLTAAERQNKYETDFSTVLQAGDLPARLVCPLFVERLDLNTFKLYNTVEPAKKQVDLIWNAFSRYPDLQEYYFLYMVNSFSMMTRFSFDEVFAHLYINYIKIGKTPWITTEERSKMGKQVSDMQGTLIGDRAANARVFTRDMKPVVIDNIEGPYTLLVFWDPNCSHCKKELPLLKTVCAPLVENKRLTVASFCMAKNQTFEECWAFNKEHDLPENWLYLHDPTGLTTLSKAYNLRTFPRLYLVDSNKKIIYRRSGEVSEQELEVMLTRLTSAK
jgi:thiol-disulfide isomerase/thioredoxin